MCVIRKINSFVYPKLRLLLDSLPEFYPLLILALLEDLLFNGSNAHESPFALHALKILEENVHDTHTQ